MPPHRLKPLLTTVTEHIDLIVQLSHIEGTLSMADILHACDDTGVPPEAREALSKRLAAQRILVQDVTDEMRVNPALTAFLNHYEGHGQLVSATGNKHLIINSVLIQGMPRYTISIITE
jgi:hypothetical protein